MGCCEGGFFPGAADDERVFSMLVRHAEMGCYHVQRENLVTDRANAAGTPD